MPRPLRVEFPGTIYHVMNRGDRREAIFVDDNDRKRFLGTLGEACEKTDWHEGVKGSVLTFDNQIGIWLDAHRMLRPLRVEAVGGRR